MGILRFGEESGIMIPNKERMQSKRKRDGQTPRLFVPAFIKADVYGNIPDNITFQELQIVFI